MDFRYHGNDKGENLSVALFSMRGFRLALRPLE
jgi:hypothetical protein